eukprot:4370963-Karenia_brevis.AAC.1
MSDPDKHQTNIMMSMVWECHNIDWASQSWVDPKSRVFCLEQNLRSGENVCFNAFLEQARSGMLSEDNYNFIHGLPAAP